MLHDLALGPKQTSEETLPSQFYDLQFRFVFRPADLEDKVRSSNWIVDSGWNQIQIWVCRSIFWFAYVFCFMFVFFLTKKFTSVNWSKLNQRTASIVIDFCTLWFTFVNVFQPCSLFLPQYSFIVSIGQHPFGQLCSLVIKGDRKFLSPGLNPEYVQLEQRARLHVSHKEKIKIVHLLAGLSLWGVQIGFQRK